MRTCASVGEAVIDSICARGLGRSIKELREMISRLLLECELLDYLIII